MTDYELYYWPSIQGRGEFVRLALEEAGAKYIDVARGPDRASDPSVVAKFLEQPNLSHPQFAVPALKAGTQVISHTANILLYLGVHHDLSPKDETAGHWTHGLQLTIADLITEVHDGHHPIDSARYYDTQKAEAQRRTRYLIQERLPKYLGYFEEVLSRNPCGARFVVGDCLTYVDLSLFQIVAGVRYAFPNAMSQLESSYPHLASVAESVALRPRIAAYLGSKRRLPFNQDGIFRHYPELDRA